jgi:hypothetical protein
MTRPWHYLFESDVSLRELKRKALISKTESAWEAYEASLKRVGRTLEAYKSYAARTFPKKGYYVLFEAVDETFNIQGPVRDKRSVSSIRHIQGPPRAENRLIAVKRGPWVDHDGPEVITAPIYRRLFNILITWAHRAGGRSDDPEDYQLYARDVDGNIREQTL